MIYEAKIEYATVADVQAHQLFLRFAGEETPSEKPYPYIKSYVPQVDDRVIVLNEVIVGGF
ncbi:MAG: hypothetical protein FWC95_07795 [Defluviitaleaceae bacterium]|nr:hypothetical protein [Defluviitaleaceae bacterium]